MASSQEELSFSVDVDESFTLDSSLLINHQDVRDGKLHIDRQKVRQCGPSLHCSMAHG